MDELRPSDPSWIGGHRLLGRLGAGGMGVVYLGRTDAGALAAIKVILPEYAQDEDFRTRFRREVDAARSVHSPWAVPVTGAETEGERPWLATAFVPGPALSDAVARRGPLPARSVMVLGRLLSRALTSVHTAGLVHRDVKPGNVLLTTDGPRLIDFGIARATDATALTSTDLIVGSPGFLSPEQASGGGTAAGPASDIFSLGCLLAYAATGRPPFGSGAVQALLYRTVHDEPDLDGVDDAGLRALLAACLAKDPGERPTAAEIDGRITEDVPGRPVEWLPEDVVRLIADRSAAMLALPDIDVTVAEESATPPEPALSDAPTEPGESGAPAAHSGRRRFLLLAAGGAVAVAGGAFAAVRLAGEDADSGGKGGASGGRRWIIGVHADLSGPRKALGKAQERGVRLAVDRFNSRKDKPFTLTVKALDDRGEPDRSVQVAERFARDRDVLAVIGPTDDATTSASLSAYDEAMLAVITLSSLAMAYAPRSKKSFFQAAPSWGALSMPIVNRLLLRPDVERLGVLMDRAGGQSAYQVGYATNMMTPSLTTGTTYPRVVPAGVADLGPVITDMLTHKSDAFFYAGDAAGAARAALALAGTPFKGPRIGQHTVMGKEFLAKAGDAATGWEFITPYTDATAPAAKEFAAAHRERFGTAPAAWAAEAYDVAGLVAEALVALVKGQRDDATGKPGKSGKPGESEGSARPGDSEGKNGSAPPESSASPENSASPGSAPSQDTGSVRPTARSGRVVRPGRAAIVAEIAASTYKGISRTYAFDEKQSLVGQDAHLYRVENGRYRYLGPAPKPAS
ncbi:bifunctional serine/threonine-protein kinase/ABC transporter substrate-binding protein [Streptomyces sp. NBC_00654]|uniref:bifunctional serine/threonine-protein kinase/ABC transporter substrate-binding protein n=1 Tax=Streptomyces sp. NBC_00654 TaxID=2975799 RepID=UPI0022576234|nr:bifunctional serine/threonine-protein kinase/ABC transporter substrate-binding protein [Streptomyces sp. NBC_00654]MCX4965515.1 bifunctional serine/threonine-protein kinase/ABC transporter substrate-binding protein [Streptomyces sp. NBC_00654]